MEEKFKYINLDEAIKTINNNGLIDTNTYVIDLKNCNGLTSEILDSLEKSNIDFKFRIYDDFYNTEKFLEKPKYNYDINQMKEIITVFEEISSSVSSFNQVGRFLYTYLLLTEIFKYSDYYSSDNKDIEQVEGYKRSIYGSLINGEGVCVGFALTLSNLLQYVGINNRIVHGIGIVSEERSGGHAWNAVEIGKKWYETDITWDLLDNISLPFCLKVNESFISSHNPYDESELDDLEYSESDFDPDLLYKYNYVITKNEEVHFKDMVEKVKSHMKKKPTMTIEEMPVKDLMKGLFSPDEYEALFSNNKSL